MNETGALLGPRQVSTAVVIPAGPRDDVADTLDSILCFIGRPRIVVIVNDTGSTAIESLTALSPDVRVLPAPRGLPAGTHGGLWIKLASAYRFVLDQGDWSVILRMDADALMTGYGLETTAANMFRTDSRLGILGAYRTGPRGGTRDWSDAAKQLRLEVGVFGHRKPALRHTLRKLLREALNHGYEPGAHALGTCLMSPRLLSEWSRLGWFDLRSLANSGLGDDQLSGLLSAAAGFATADLSGPDDQMAVHWRGLPHSPDTLLSRGKTIVHSVRFFEELTEVEIRRRFRDARPRRR